MQKSWARDQAWATAVTRAAAVAIPDRYPAEPQGNSLDLQVFAYKREALFWGRDQSNARKRNYSRLFKQKEFNPGNWEESRSQSRDSGRILAWEPSKVAKTLETEDLWEEVVSPKLRSQDHLTCWTQPGGGVGGWLWKRKLREDLEVPQEAERGKHELSVLPSSSFPPMPPTD